MVFSSILLFCLALYGWFSGLLVGRKAFSLFILAIAVYSLGGALELISPTLSGKIFWKDFAYIG